MGSYLTSQTGAPIIRERIGKGAVIETLPFGATMTIGDTIVSLHPAGHILGSSQVRVEHRGEVWVVSGDYKVESDATCETFEPVRCHTFVTETTFALEKYKWKPQADIFAKINDWWQLNAMWGRSCVLFGYSLGKAQRLLAGLDPSIGPILTYHTVDAFCAAYKKGGISFPEYTVVNAETIKAYKGRGAILIAPQEVKKYGLLDDFGEYETGFASGWMANASAARSTAYDIGFALSDHADWEGLLSAITDTSSERVVVMHGFSEQITPYLKSKGYDVHRWH